MAERAYAFLRGLVLVIYLKHDVIDKTGSV